MSYQKIDSIISEWVSQNDLFLCKKYQDAEVRSVDIVSNSCNRYQIWIDHPKNGTVSVHAWDYNKSRMDWNVSKNNLSDCLKNALITVSNWKKNEAQAAAKND